MTRGERYVSTCTYGGNELVLVDVAPDSTSVIYIVVVLGTHRETNLL